jgi:TolB protein
MMNADGSASSRVQITSGGEYIRHVVWSPDGQWLVFDSTLDTGGATSQRTQLYRMAPDGSQRTRLTSNSAQDISPCWSPDGKLILFSSNRDHGGGSGGINLYDIYVMTPDAGAVIRITTNGPNAFVTAHGWKQP